MKFKKSFLPNLLVEKGIAFGNCGVAQKTYEHMRDGKIFGDDALSKIEEKCNILRGVDFDIEYDFSVVDKRRRNTRYDNISEFKNYINFENLDIEKIPYHTPEEILNAAKQMHRLNLHSLRKIKEMSGSIKKISWAIDLPEFDKSDKNILKTPIDEPFYYKDKIQTTLENNRNDYGSVRDIDPRLEDDLSLTELLKIFDENFSKKIKDIYNFTGGSSNLLDSFRKGSAKHKACDQSEIILDYLNYNGYEFQYSIVRRVEEIYLKIADTQDQIDKIESGNYLPVNTIEEAKNITTNGLCDPNFIENSKIQNSKLSIMYQRYLDDIEKSDFVTFRHSAFHLYLAIVKLKTKNFAIYDNRFKDAISDEDFHSHKNNWAKEKSQPDKTKSKITFLDGRYIPQAVPIICHKDYDAFIKVACAKEVSEGILDPKDFKIIKDSVNKMEVSMEFFPLLKKIFSDKIKFRQYTQKLIASHPELVLRNFIDEKFVTAKVFPSYKKKSSSEESSENIHIKCLPNNTAYYESYLSYLAIFYRYYSDKLSDSEYFIFIDSFISDIRDYQSHFGSIVKIKN